MSDQDNLRDRMAEVLSRTYTSGPAKVVLEDIAAAQAIIDSLHLESYDVATGDGYPTTHVHGWMEDQ